MKGNEKDSVDTNINPGPIGTNFACFSSRNPDPTISAEMSVNVEDFALPVEARNPVVIRMHKRFRNT